MQVIELEFQTSLQWISYFPIVPSSPSELQVRKPHI